MNSALPTISAVQLTDSKYAALQQAYHPLDRTATYIIGCVDDRKPTAASAAALVEEQAERGATLSSPLTDGYIRFPGGVIGLYETLLTTLAIQRGPKALAKMPDFITGAHQTAERIRTATNGHVVPGVHLNCKAAAVGAVTEIGLTEPAVQSAAKAVFTERFHGLSRLQFEDIIRGKQLVAAYYFGPRPAEFAVDPKAFAGTDVPIMELEGEHEDPAHTVFVENFDPTSISNPAKAIEVWGRQAYNLDATLGAELLLRAYPSLNLNTATLLTVIATGIFVRGALAGKTHGFDPRTLANVSRGRIATALDYLAILQRHLQTTEEITWQ